jgi:hypothetical protein
VLGLRGKCMTMVGQPTYKGLTREKEPYPAAAMIPIPELVWFSASHAHFPHASRITAWK